MAMTSYRSCDGERIDEIVYRTYASLEPIALVLEANPHLLIDARLSSGDMVNLPDWQPLIAKEGAKTLW